MSKAVASAFILLLFACGDAPSGSEDESPAIEKRCLRMRDHLVHLRIENTMPVRTSRADKAGFEATAQQHRDAMVAALGDDFSERCARSMTRKQIDCVVDAEDTAAVAACRATQ